LLANSKISSAAAAAPRARRGLRRTLSAAIAIRLQASTSGDSIGANNLEKNANIDRPKTAPQHYDS
jgi:hypothetical protein